MPNFYFVQIKYMCLFYLTKNSPNTLKDVHASTTFKIDFCFEYYDSWFFKALWINSSAKMCADNLRDNRLPYPLILSYFMGITIPLRGYWSIFHGFTGTATDNYRDSVFVIVRTHGFRTHYLNWEIKCLVNKQR